MNKDVSERRRYFRVTDQIGLQYLLTEDDRDVQLVDPDVARRATDIARLEQQILLRIDQLRSEHNELVPVLELLNQKINLSLSSGYFSDVTHLSGKNRRYLDVSLSACGIAFPAEEPVGIGEMLRLYITLYPSNVVLSITAIVVACDTYSSDDQSDICLIRADFTELAEPDHEILIQHVVKRQNLMLKERRENKSQG